MKARFALVGRIAADVLDSVEKASDRVEVLLIHCEAGLSRSSGVATALSLIYYGDDGRWFEYDFPNTLVYHLLVEGHKQRVSKA